MGKLTIISLLLLVSISLVAQESHPGLLKLISNVVVKLETDPIIVSAVRAKNEQNESSEEIQKHDQEWMAAKSPTPFMNSLLENDVSEYLRKLSTAKAYYAEIFVMDKNGALVALSDLTSDYWQGDEDKFTKSYANGEGKTFIDNAKYDESSKKTLVQVSVPVKDGEKVIGAITVGIVVDEIE